MAPNSFLAEEDRPGRIEADKERDCREERREQNEADRGRDDIKYSLGYHRSTSTTQSITYRTSLSVIRL